MRIRSVECVGCVYARVRMRTRRRVCAWTQTRGGGCIYTAGGCTHPRVRIRGEVRIRERWVRIREYTM